MTNGSCFWLDASALACTKAAWPSCGYSWLVSAPVGLLWGVWLVYGLGRLRQATRLTNGFQFDTDKIHDPLAQGMAVALAQRKSTSIHKPKFQRYMKLGAMWAEWPTLSYTPLTIAFKVAGSSGFLSSMLVSLNLPFELANLILAVACGGSILVLRHGKRLMRLHDMYLKKYAYPMTFDVLYIPLISTFVRLATCPAGYEHIALPGGATCNCVDRFGISWSIGFAGFVVLYTSALHYKMFIEPHGATMDFRFQTSFQIIMVMALNPIVSVLVSDLDVTTFRSNAILLASGFLARLAFLFVYNYKAQPCIGSGRIPNNIRALSFSSSIYTTLCVLGFLFSNAAIVQLYYALTPLPIVWVLAWHRNNRRAHHFHVPDLSILELLRDHSSRSKTVGTIAALYMDPLKLHVVHYAAIIAQLEKITQRSHTQELLCRAYALRTLWFCHIENFRKQRLAVGEDRKQMAMPPKMWFKDIENIDRKSKARPRLLAADEPILIVKQTVKIQRVHRVKDVMNMTTSLANLHPFHINALQRLTPMLRPSHVAPVTLMGANRSLSRRGNASQRSSTSALEMPRVKRRPLRLSEPDTLPSSRETCANKLLPIAQHGSTETLSTPSSETAPTKPPSIKVAAPQPPMLDALQQATRPSMLRNIDSGQTLALSNASVKHTSSISDLQRSSGWKHTLSMSKLVAPMLCRLTGTSRPIATSNYHTVLIHDKHWISKDESPDDAVFHSIGLFNTALEVLAQACALGDKPSMHEIAMFILQWYRSGYLQLPKTIYLHVLSTLTATADRKQSADATHTIHKLCTGRVLPLQLWLKNASYLNNFVVALGHPSPTTVFKCASVLALVLQAAEQHTKTNLFLLLTPESIQRVHCALAKWHSMYHISATLEAICLRLHHMEIAQFAKRLDTGTMKKFSGTFMKWIHETFTLRFVRLIVQSIDSVKPSNLTNNNTMTDSLTRRKSESHLGHSLGHSCGVPRFSRSILLTSMTVRITPAGQAPEKPRTPPEHTPPASVPRHDGNADVNPPPQLPSFVEPSTASSDLLPPALPPAFDIHDGNVDVNPPPQLPPFVEPPTASSDLLPPTLPPAVAMPIDEQVETGRPLSRAAPRASRLAPCDTPDLPSPTTSPPSMMEACVGPSQELVATSDIASNAGVNGSEGPTTTTTLTVAAILASATQQLLIPVGAPLCGPHVALLSMPQADVADFGPPSAAMPDAPSPISSFLNPSRKTDSARLGSRISVPTTYDTRTSSVDDDASLELLASRNQSFYTVDLLLDGDGNTLTSAGRKADGPSRRIMRPDQYVVVPPAVLSEVRRRRTQRRHLLEALRTAQKVHRDFILVRASKKELSDALASVAVAYRSATECAIIDFAKVGLDPDLQTFFASVVAPFLTPSDHKVHEKRCSALWLPPAPT